MERSAAIERGRDRVEPRRRGGGGPLLVGEAHAGAVEDQVRAQLDRRDRLLLAPGGAASPLQPARHRARVAEVLAHQRLDPLLRPGAEAAQAVGRDLLQLVGQHVRVAPGLEMEHRTDAQQEVLRLIEAVAVDRVRRIRRAAEREQQPRRRDVTQPAGRVLEVGLELIERVVELRVALRDQRQQRLEHLAASVPHRALEAFARPSRTSGRRRRGSARPSTPAGRAGCRARAPRSRRAAAPGGRPGA